MTQIAHNPQSELPASVSVLGIRVDRLTQQVLAYIESFLQQYVANDQQVVCRQVITMNPEFIMAAQHNAQFRQCINEAALVAPERTLFL